MKGTQFDKVIKLFFEAMIAKVFAHYNWVVTCKLWPSQNTFLSPTVKKDSLFPSIFNNILEGDGSQGAPRIFFKLLEGFA